MNILNETNTSITFTMPIKIEYLPFIAMIYTCLYVTEHNTYYDVETATKCNVPVTNGMIIPSLYITMTKFELFNRSHIFDKTELDGDMYVLSHDAKIQDLTPIYYIKGNSNV